MSKKTVKDLEADFSEFKNLFKDLQIKFNLLSEKHEALEKRYDEAMTKKCKDYICVKREKVFSEEWQLKAHCKIQVERYSCEVCERTFKCEDIKSKHQQIAHENLKLYAIISLTQKIVHLKKNVFSSIRFPKIASLELSVNERCVCSDMRL